MAPARPPVAGPTIDREVRWRAGQPHRHGRRDGGMPPPPPRLPFRSFPEAGRFDRRFWTRTAHGGLHPPIRVPERVPAVGRDPDGHRVGESDRLHQRPHLFWRVSVEQDHQLLPGLDLLAPDIRAVLLDQLAGAEDGPLLGQRYQLGAVCGGEPARRCPARRGGCIRRSARYRY